LDDLDCRCNLANRRRDLLRRQDTLHREYDQRRADHDTNGEIPVEHALSTDIVAMRNIAANAEQSPDGSEPVELA
jgi:hypothetical protein